MHARVVFLLVCLAAARADDGEPPTPFTFDVGRLRLNPGGFVDIIGMSRSASTNDTVLTGFGRIPLSQTPGQTIVSLRRSRLTLGGEWLSEGRLGLGGYIESDFLNTTPGESVWRWRQAWGTVRYGKWEILGGQAWSLLRPNRRGMASYRMMSTDVIDPATHVGITGLRVKQVRVSRTLGDYHTVVAWETRGNFLVRGGMDKHWGHAEATAFTGRRGQRGISLSGTINLSPKFRFVTQKYWSRRAAFEALRVVPAGVNGGATISGFEYLLNKRVEVYSYGGLVYASRSAGNRLVREWTLGGDYQVPMPSIRGSATFSLQFSQLDRSVWTGRSGMMSYLMYRARYTFN